MKRVLFISQFLERAGVETFMMNVFRGINHQHFQVDFLLYSQEETEYSREVEDAGCKVWRVTSRRESPFRWYKELYIFFKTHAHEYSAIHYNGNGLTAIFPFILAYIFRIPVRIAHSHSSSSSGFHNKLLHKLHRPIVKHITTHHFACSSAAAKWFFGKSPSIIIKNGIDTERFAFNPQIRQTVRASFNINPTTTVIGHIGRFEPEKNHTFLLDIFAAYIQLHPNALLLLVGIGRLMDDTKAKAQQLGIAEKILFLGERSDVNELLQAMDCFIMPSTFEGQPFVLIEAQCAGLPCLVSDVVNIDICLTDNIRRYPLEKSSIDWAQETFLLLSDYHREDGSKSVQQKGYSIINTIDYLEKVYDNKL